MREYLVTYDGNERMHSHLQLR